MITLLIMAWLLDGGLTRYKQLLREPLIQAILLLCVLLLVGLFWGDELEDGRHKWRKYFLLLIYIPFFSLLNKQRLPWALGALFVGYGVVLSAGLYEWLENEQQGVPILNISYLGFSAMLGIGAIVSCCLASMSRSRLVQVLFSMLTLALLYLQFHQSARGFLLATLLTLMLLVVRQLRISLTKLVGVSLSLMLIVVVFAYNSDVVQERWSQAGDDWHKLQAGNYSSSIGYRLAMWDVGLHGIIQRPLEGNGTGMAASYFDHAIVTYKDGIYKELPHFQVTEHYHNDWFEIGMHLGLLGMSAFVFLLWAWYQTFSRCYLRMAGIAMISFIFLSGLTETFLIFYRIPILLLITTAVAICWQRIQLEKEVSMRNQVSQS